jgi:hypothetical protein
MITTWAFRHFFVSAAPGSHYLPGGDLLFFADRGGPRSEDCLPPSAKSEMALEPSIEIRNED